MQESPAVGTTATVIAVSYAVVCGLAILFMLGVAVSTRGRARETDTRRLGDREKTWFAIVVVLLVSLLFATIFFTPYSRGAGGHSQVLNVQGQQFAWTGLHSVRTGEEVEFRLTSKDVNHGFAVYTAGGELLFQVQVMPGKTQIYRYTFHKPGTYRILCLEFCGVNHDLMTAQLTVTT
jgi:cytochrome c oxidase subunit 2